MKHVWLRKWKFAYEAGSLWHCRRCRRVHVSEWKPNSDGDYLDDGYWDCP